MLSIIAISDLHGLLPDTSEYQGDILCICGDTFPLSIQTHARACEEWFTEEFIPWAQEIKVDKILLIAGNHDFFFYNSHLQRIHNLIKDTKIVYLENDVFEYQGKVFYGTPYCKQFGNWAFMRDDETLEIIFSNIPNNVDVLITHDAPFGCSDICEQDVSWNSHTHIGNIPLKEAVLKKQPKFLIHGHLHTSNHELEILGGTQVYCVSLLDEHYKHTYKPLIFEI
jgi:Icc-related predicted phosphoesterase